MGASRPVVCRQPEDGRRRDDDSELVAAVQDGDVSAYAELFRRHHLAVKRVCARRLGEVEADEVAQATFVRAFERIDQCLGDRRFGAWVQVIAQRLCLDLVRARSRTVPDDDPLRDDRLALNVVIDLDAGTVTEEALVRRERTERVQEALALLPDRQREVVVARHFEGRRPPEIAASLGLSVGAVDSLLLRARRRLALNYEHVLADSSAATPSVTGAGVASTGIPAHLPALPDAVASAGSQVHLPSLPDAVATVVHHAAAALPAIHADAHAPLRRLAAVVAAAAAPILISAPSAAPPTTATGTGPTVVVNLTPNVHPPAADRPLPAGAAAAGATPGGHDGPSATSATSAATPGGGERGQAPAGAAEVAAAVAGVVRAGDGPTTRPHPSTGQPSGAGASVPPGLAAVVPAAASEPGPAGRDKPAPTPPRRPPGLAVTVPTPPAVPPTGAATASPAAAAAAGTSKERRVPQPPAAPAGAAANAGRP